MLLFLVGILSVHAETLRGYLNEKPLSARYFIAVEDGAVVETVPIRGFPKREQDTMHDCMLRKHSHAVMMEKMDGPYLNVRCAKAPGFYDRWSVAADRIGLP